MVSLDSFRPVCFLTLCYVMPCFERVFPLITSPSREKQSPLEGMWDHLTLRWTLRHSVVPMHAWAGVGWVIHVPWTITPWSATRSAKGMSLMQWLWGWDTAFWLQWGVEHLQEGFFTQDKAPAPGGSGALSCLGRKACGLLPFRSGALIYSHILLWEVCPYMLLMLPACLFSGILFALVNFTARQWQPVGELPGGRFGVAPRSPEHHTAISIIWECIFCSSHTARL